MSKLMIIKTEKWLTAFKGNSRTPFSLATPSGEGKGTSQNIYLSMRSGFS